MADQETTPPPADPDQAEKLRVQASAADAVEDASASAAQTGDAFADALLASTEAAINDAANDPTASNGPAASKDGDGVDWPDFAAAKAGGEGAGGGAGLDLLSDVSLNVKIELGRTRMFVEDVLRLTSGAVVELDKLAGDPVDIYVNDRRVARGEVLVVNDNFCVRVSEIIASPGDEDEKRS